MDVGTSEFRREACGAIHQSTDSQPELASSLKRLVQNRFFVGEEVIVEQKSSDKVGKIVLVQRSSSPSNKENELKYNVEVGTEILQDVAHSKLKRKNEFDSTTLFTFITEVAHKTSSAGPWVLRDPFIKSYGIKEQHQMYTFKSAASADAATPPISKKPRMNDDMKSNGTFTRSRPSFLTIDEEASNADATTSTSTKKKAAAKVPKLQRSKKTTPTKKKTNIAKKTTTSKASTSKAATSKSTAKSSPKSKKSTAKSETSTSKKKEAMKQLTLSGFLSPNTSGSQKSTKGDDSVSYEDRMNKRVVNKTKEIVKKLYTMDTKDLDKSLELMAKAIPPTCVNSIPNEFVRYLVAKFQTQAEAKGMSAADRANFRKTHMHEFVLRNEFFWFHLKLKTGKFEDTWIQTEVLPEIPLVVPLTEQDVFIKCARVCTFIQTFRDVMDVAKPIKILELFNALSFKEEGFEKVTGPILIDVTDFIRRNQKNIPHFTRGKFVNYNVKPVSIELAQEVARKILFPKYKMRLQKKIREDDGEEEEEEQENGDFLMDVDLEQNIADKFNLEADEPNRLDDGDQQSNSNSVDYDSDSAKSSRVKKTDNDDEDAEDSEGEADQQSKEDDELCQRFTRIELYNLKPLEQARIFELILERVEVSGPVRNSMSNQDGDVKKLAKSITTLKDKIQKLNDKMEELAPMIPEELYSEYSRAQTISAMKSNRKRREFQTQVDEHESNINELQNQMMELRALTRYRPISLGYDRFMRRWWFFPPSPGIFIEQGAFTTSTETDETKPLVLPERKKFHTYDVDTETLMKHLRVLLNGAYPSPTAPVRWFHINSRELLDQAIEQLANGGVRESELKINILESREAIVQLFTSS
ncbi:Bromodomain adjacent to zinc finger domain 1A [Aphelenchoides besseyi]|nr:Bromodomain adjacent to zinc finger domain 1A [Aphelenchoides besseyi]